MKKKHLVHLFKVVQILIDLGDGQMDGFIIKICTNLNQFLNNCEGRNSGLNEHKGVRGGSLMTRLGVITDGWNLASAAHVKPHLPGPSASLPSYSLW